MCTSYRLLLAFATLFVLGPVMAAEAARPCHNDVQKFCADVKTGGGAIAKCLKEHQADLSDACKTHMAGMKQGMQQKAEKIHSACKGDAETVCKGIPAGKGRLWACLKSNKSALSDGCKEAMEKDMEKHD